MFACGVSHRGPFTTVRVAWALLVTGVHQEGTPPLSLLEPVSSSKTGRNPERMERHAAMLVVTDQSLLGGVSLEAVHQLVWAIGQ